MSRESPGVSVGSYGVVQDLDDPLDVSVAEQRDTRSAAVVQLLLGQDHPELTRSDEPVRHGAGIAGA
jgi:hypothetical protein